MVRIITILSFIILLSSCVSVMEKAGRVVDGSAFEEKRIAQYSGSSLEVTVVENRAGEQSVKITLDNFPMMALRGSMPDENGGFFLTSLEYLAGNVQGWNEYSMDILGEGSLVLGSYAVLELNEEIETVQITAGRIHRYDTRIVGSDALTSLRNRNERITATVEWMTSIEDSPQGQTIEDFERHWKPVLFPEIVSNRNRPADWLREGDTFQRAEDIRWNTGYTERVFSEELAPVRDSGTLLRDWEEALSWIYLKYEWENIRYILSRPITLQSIK